jgi:hypothetical protein
VGRGARSADRQGARGGQGIHRAPAESLIEFKQDPRVAAISAPGWNPLGA